MAAPRMAPGQAPEDEPRSSDGTVPLQRLEGIGGAAGVEAAGRRAPGEERAGSRGRRRAGRERPGSSLRPRRSWRRRARPARSTASSPTPRCRRARYEPAGSRPSAASWRRAARRRRRTRFRSTAPPAALPTAKPARGGVGATPRSGGSQVTVSGPRRARRPCWRSAWNVRRSVMRQSCGRAELTADPWTAVGIVVGPQGRLRREALATLEPTGSDHGAAGAVGHAVPEAVALGAAAVVRLVGALHGG